MKKEELISEVEKMLPSDAMVSDYAFEGANLVVYTKNKRFFFSGDETIRDIVNTVKKRVELRADESLLLDLDKTEALIRKVIPPESGIANIWFDVKRSIVDIEAEKPGMAIGKSGENVLLIKKSTFWIPKIMRSPSAKSDIIDTIRATLYKNSDYRRKFMNKIGERIYSGWERDSKYWVRMSFLGGAREVGRSCILLQTPESRVLLDCGVNVASKADAFPHLDAPEMNIKALDAVVITHAHLDHSGFLPFLFKYGYQGPVYATAPTRDIMTLLQVDYIDINQREGGKQIYSIKDITESIKHTIDMNYNVVTDITPDVRLTLYNAGHVLGSAMAHLNIGNGFHNLLYTGDMKFLDTGILPCADSRFQRLETIVVESTYGGSKDMQPSRKESDELIISAINKTIERGGKVLIPVLGVGRSQEIIIILDRLMRQNMIKEVPIYIDGVVWDVTAIHTAYIDFMNSNVKNLIFKKDYNPFTGGYLKRVGSQKERQNIIEEQGSCIILATSGMLVGGPSVGYLRNLADDKRNSLIFVSYQGEGSLGKTIQNGSPEVPIEGIDGRNEILKINLEVHTLEGFSGHSDRRQLMDFFRTISPRPRKAIVVHGESSKCLNLASSIHKNLRIETAAPRVLDVLRIR